MSKIKRIIAFMLICAMCVPVFACGGKGAEQVSFAVKDGTGVQNIKKFDNFTSTWPWVGETPGSVDNRSLSTVPALTDIKAESLRFDLFMGFTGLGYNIGKGANSGTTDAEYSQVSQLLTKLKDAKVNPYISYFANADFSKAAKTDSWKAVPDPVNWEQLCYNIASKMDEMGVRLGGHEIWNEPDFGSEFFNGTWVDYVKTYIAGAKGVRRANPDATVGAMAAAHIFDRVNKKTTVDGVAKSDFARFVEMSTASGTLPDFISWHYYGRETQISGRADESENFDAYLLPIRNALNTFQNGTNAEATRAYSELETVQQHVNEFNIYQPAVDTVYMNEGMLPGMFYAFDKLLAATDLTRIAWASLLGEKNDGLSYDLINALSLQRYPAYHALWMYSRLPVDRVKVTLKNDKLGTMAGIDDGRAGLIVYNKSNETVNSSVKLDGIPFAKGDVNVYLVDKNSFTYTTKNEPKLVKQLKDVYVNGVEVDMQLLKNSACYIEINNTQAKSDTEIDANVGKIVKKDYWYFDRGDNKPFADVHENSLTAHVGMVGDSMGRAACGVTIDGLINKDTLNVKYEAWGAPIKTSTTAIGIKVDYATSAGYTKSVFYNIKDFGADLMLPFGARTMSDEIVSMGDTLKGSYDIVLKQNAPSGWNGRVMLSYIIKDAGIGATAKFIIK